MDNVYYCLSRLASLDVKWSDCFNAGSASFLGSHYNPYCQLIVAAEGPVRIEAAGCRHTLASGESLLLLPWEEHTGWGGSEGQGSFYWAQFSCHPGLKVFDAERAPDLKIVHAENTELRTFSPSHDDLLIIPQRHLSKQRFQLLGLFEQLTGESDTPKGYFRFQQTLLLGRLLHLIAADFLEQNDKPTSFPASYKTYRKVANYLNHSYEQEFSKSQLEHTLDRKYEYLCQVFKNYARTTIVQYIHQLRIQRAKYLLHHSDQKIAEIARLVGFEDAFYFSRVFKRYEGIAPQQYRERRGEDTEL